MYVSVILSTYNSPDWLEKAMWGYAVQQHRTFELVIADDGSTAETKQRLERVGGETGIPVRHVWQPDEGFNKCGILNRAVLAARHEYLVFSDGDCIPRRDFLFEHVRLARPGYLLSGGAVRIPRDLSERITCDDIRSGRCARAR